MAISPSESLDDILVIEREIAAMLAGERAKAAQWLEDTKRSIDQTAQAELARVHETAAVDQERARETARLNAASIVEKAESVAARLDSLGDEQLKPIVWRHVATIGCGVRP